MVLFFIWVLSRSSMKDVWEGSFKYECEDDAETGDWSSGMIPV